MVWERLGSASVSGSIANNSWKVLGRATGGSSTMDTGTFTAKDNLMILIFATAGTEVLTFNGQSSSGNFANRRIEENQSGSGSAQTGQNNVNFSRNVGEDMFIVGTINNVSGAPKLGIFHNVSDNTGSTSSPKKQEWAVKYNDNSQITRVTLTSDSGNYGSDDELVVLGMDNDESDSGTNFWQELKTQKLTSNSSSSNAQFDTGSFTAKNFLMVKGFLKTSTDPKTLFNDDSSSNYSNRYVDNGSEGTSAGSTSAFWHYGGNEVQFTAFICNKANQRKFYIVHLLYYSGSGSSSTMATRELFGKWVNNSQITSIQSQKSSMTTYAGTYMKIYGAD
tara:strand:- start:560 stop:1564 length:1005 start_codon:yes stop_codon:yes gene_type:complete